MRGNFAGLIERLAEVFHIVAWPHAVMLSGRLFRTFGIRGTVRTGSLSSFRFVRSSCCSLPHSQGMVFYEALYWRFWDVVVVEPERIAASSSALRRLKS